MRRISTGSLVLLLVLLATAATAGAAISASVGRTARAAATARAKTLGVHARPERWRVSCARTGRGSYRCGMRFNSGQCKGTVYLKAFATSYAVTRNTVACGE